MEKAFLFYIHTFTPNYKAHSVSCSSRSFRWLLVEEFRLPENHLTHSQVSCNDSLHHLSLLSASFFFIAMQNEPIFQWRWFNGRTLWSILNFKNGKEMPEYRNVEDRASAAATKTAAAATAKKSFSARTSEKKRENAIEISIRLVV